MQGTRGLVITPTPIMHPPCYSPVTQVSVCIINTHLYIIHIPLIHALYRYLWNYIKFIDNLSVCFIQLYTILYTIALMYTPVVHNNARDRHRVWVLERVGFVYIVLKSLYGTIVRLPQARCAEYSFVSIVVCKPCTAGAPSILNNIQRTAFTLQRIYVLSGTIVYPLLFNGRELKVEIPFRDCTLGQKENKLFLVQTFRYSMWRIKIMEVEEFWDTCEVKCKI